MGMSHVAELMSFLYTLPSYLQENPKVPGNALIILGSDDETFWLQVTLLVLASFSFFFQLPPATVNATSWRSALLECSKRIFTVACVSRNLTIVLTSQLSTKMIKADGSVGNFDNGTRAIMTPSLGKSNAHFWDAKHAVSDRRTRVFLPTRVQGVPGDDNAKVANVGASLFRLFH